MQKNYSKRYLLKAKQTLKRTRPSGEEGKQRTDHERRPREDDERDATPQRDAAPSIGSAWERHRREGVNEEGERVESSTSALLGVPEVEGQKQEDSEEERCAVG